MMALVRVDFACNNPDNGLPTGHCTMIQLPDQLLELYARNWNLGSDRPAPRFREEGDHIVLSGKRWPFERSTDWYGNWCWNAYWMRDRVARQFFVWLHGRKLFDVECGEGRLFNLWKLDQPLDLEPEKEHPNGLGRLFIKAMLAEMRP